MMSLASIAGSSSAAWVDNSWASLSTLCVAFEARGLLTAFRILPDVLLGIVAACAASNKLCSSTLQAGTLVVAEPAHASFLETPVSSMFSNVCAAAPRLRLHINA